VIGLGIGLELNPRINETSDCRPMTLRAVTEF